MGRIALFACIAFSLHCAAQENKDTVLSLKPVLIQAYAANRLLIDVPVSVATLSGKDLFRYNDASLLPAVNSVPGARMEERSPGSYRFSIRGSLLRSPFGVRNVKFYYNGAPFTDGGGNTYFNLIDLSFIDNIEIIKGPGGSLYGAGTGGVVLLHSPTVRRNQVVLSAVVGGYGLQRYQVAGQLKQDKKNIRVNYSHQSVDGFRVQSAMKRDALSADIVWQLSSRTTLQTSFLYADLRYETPGGLTSEEANANPAQARPSAGTSRGAVEQRAKVNNQSPFVAFAFDHDWNEKWSSKLVLFGSYADFTNPAIRNYEQRHEANLGTRNENTYRFGSKRIKGKWTTGVEGQYLKSRIKVYDNEMGTRANLQVDDRLRSLNGMLFSQLELDLPLNFAVTAGTSLNFSRVLFARDFPTMVDENRSFSPVLSPRVAVLNKITPFVSLFVSASRGFSPPTLAELYPSRQIFDKTIDAEYGTNFELGVRSDELFDALTVDFTVYRFSLDNALVVRRDASFPGEPEYFVNAGGTDQKGIEAYVSYSPLKDKNTMISDLILWNSFAWSDYDFRNYFNAEDDFSGNHVTGISPIVNTTGLDVTLLKALYIYITANYVEETPLNDLNTVFADKYFLMNLRTGYRFKIKANKSAEVFFGSNNVLDERYSLGNDLNAFGGRYFNPAPPRNYFAGFRLTLAK